MNIEVNAYGQRYELAGHLLYPLFVRASRFGLYCWAYWFVLIFCNVVVSAATDSFWFTLAFSIAAAFALDGPAKQAGIERTVRKWARDVERMEASRHA